MMNDLKVKQKLFKATGSDRSFRYRLHFATRTRQDSTGPDQMMKQTDVDNSQTTT